MESEKLFCYADESSTPYEENEHDWSEQDDIILEKVIKRDFYLMDETDAPYKEGEYERTAADDIVLLNLEFGKCRIMT